MTWSNLTLEEYIESIEKTGKVAALWKSENHQPISAHVCFFPQGQQVSVVMYINGPLSV